ncbi:carbohydrate deacetylase [Enterococcus faecalis]|uniref:carbohydrate deacetylase n=1 Tax=Enterococcus faecalis TaxID=1351 RepID=UPI002090D287|nr:carbohydrate deacetylase [Enterococcus faecalis]MCO5446190.1 carbohydrate deacetylase [Enterococcus faecalis]
MKKVIINADDFGYSSGVNAGILKAFQEGVLTSTTLMANMPGCDEAIYLAKANPGLGVGGHLVLTCGAAKTFGKSIVDSEGEFYKLEQYRQLRCSMDDEEIFNEWCSQIDYLIDNGLNLTHLDSHHHVHTFPENLAITKRIAYKYQLPFRNAFALEKNQELPCQKGITGFLDLMNYPAIRDLTQSFEENKDACFSELQAVLDKIEEGEITELMVHPAFVDELLYFHSSFNIARVKEVAILCDPMTEALLSKNNVALFHYGNVPNIVREELR